MGDAKQQRLRLWRSRGSHSLASSLEAAMQSTEIIIVVGRVAAGTMVSWLWGDICCPPVA